MKVLLVASRFPWPPYSGDRLRTSIWIDALAAHADVALVCPEGVVPDGLSRFAFHPAKRSIPATVRAVREIVRRGLPLQSLLAATYDWDDAIGRARADVGPFDATVVILSRLDPSVRHLAEGGTILDAIDSLARNAGERARAASLAAPLWRIEARRVRRAEADAVRAYDRVLVVSESEAVEMYATAISNGIAIRPLDASRRRRWDFGFWGRLAYFANADAARMLLRDVWPAIRRVRPDATLAIAGSAVPGDLAREAAAAGVTLISPVDDMAAFARDVAIALIPMRFGSGQSSKTLDAAEAGCAVAGTEEAFRGLELLRPHATVADAQELAHAAVALLDDEPRRIAQASALRSLVERHYARETTHARLRQVVSEVAA